MSFSTGCKVSEIFAGVLASILTALLIGALLAFTRLKPVLATWYASLGEQNDGAISVLFELTCSNWLLLYIFSDVSAIGGSKAFLQGSIIFLGFWPFWMFFGFHTPGGGSLKSAWRNYRQTWFKVFAGYCFSLFSLVVFVFMAVVFSLTPN
jgi:hypothetical protein